MSFRNSVIIVASPRPRVGKTLLARLLVDYYAQEGRPVKAFDLNAGDGTLAQFLPDQVTSSEIANVQGQMALFDLLVTADDTVKIVDVGHDAYEFVFLVGSSHRFCRRSAPARHRAGYPVHDFARPRHRRRLPYSARPLSHARLCRRCTTKCWDPARCATNFRRPAAARRWCGMPALAPGLRKYVERPPFSFSGPQLANARNIPIDSHIELQRWLRRIFLEFRELDLRVLLADLQSSIRLDQGLYFYPSRCLLVEFIQ